MSVSIQKLKMSEILNKNLQNNLKKSILASLRTDLNQAKQQILIKSKIIQQKVQQSSLSSPPKQKESSHLSRAKQKDDQQNQSSNRASSAMKKKHKSISVISASKLKKSSTNSESAQKYPQKSEENQNEASGQGQQEKTSISKFRETCPNSLNNSIQIGDKQIVFTKTKGKTEENITNSTGRKTSKEQKETLKNGSSQKYSHKDSSESLSRDISVREFNYTLSSSEIQGNEQTDNKWKYSSSINGRPGNKKTLQMVYNKLAFAKGFAF